MKLHPLNGLIKSKTKKKRASMPRERHFTTKITEILENKNVDLMLNSLTCVYRCADCNRNSTEYNPIYGKFHGCWFLLITKFDVSSFLRSDLSLSNVVFRCRFLVGDNVSITQFQLIHYGPNKLNAYVLTMHVGLDFVCDRSPHSNPLWSIFVRNPKQLFG